jgi:hypothetical protein
MLARSWLSWSRRRGRPVLWWHSALGLMKMSRLGPLNPPGSTSARRRGGTGSSRASRRARRPIAPGLTMRGAARVSIARDDGSDADVLRYLEAKDVTLRCRSCGGTEFGIYNESQHQDRMSILSFKYPDHDEAGMYDVLMLACEHCAHLQFYARAPIARWADKNPSS